MHRHIVCHTLVHSRAHTPSYSSSLTLSPPSNNNTTNLASCVVGNNRRIALMASGSLLYRLSSAPTSPDQLEILAVSYFIRTPCRDVRTYGRAIILTDRTGNKSRDWLRVCAAVCVTKHPHTLSQSSLPCCLTCSMHINTAIDSMSRGRYRGQNCVGISVAPGNISISPPPHPTSLLCMHCTVYPLMHRVCVCVTMELWLRAALKVCVCGQLCECPAWEKGGDES